MVVLGSSVDVVVLVVGNVWWSGEIRWLYGRVKGIGGGGSGVVARMYGNGMGGQGSFYSVFPFN